MLKTKTGPIDKVLLLAVILISLLGIIFIYSATWDKTGGINALVFKQSVWVLVGFAFLFIIANLDYLKILDFAYLAYGLNLVFLLAGHGSTLSRP